MEDKQIEPDPIPPVKKRKWLTKRVMKVISICGNILPSFVALAAILLAYGQSKEANETNFRTKKFEITYNEKRRAYIDFMAASDRVVWTTNELNYFPWSEIDTSYTPVTEFNKCRVALSTFLNFQNSVEFSNICDAYIEDSYILQYNLHNMKASNEQVNIISEKRLNIDITKRYFRFTLSQVLFSESNTDLN